MINSSYIPKEQDSEFKVNKFYSFLDRIIVEQNTRIFKSLDHFNFIDKKSFPTDWDLDNNSEIEESKHPYESK